MQGEAFVARERELGQLDIFLRHALEGRGTVCFVTGEAGSGKTALVTAFAQRALEGHPDLVVAVGQSDAQTGAGDPYLPFREILAQLTGDVDAKLAQGAISQENAGRLRKLLHLSGQALADVGPDLIGIFIPFAGLATRVAAFVAEKAGWLDKLKPSARRKDTSSPAGIEQSHIFEQYTNVLRALAAKKPLLLLLDDLQWADAASIDLLFCLGRRIGDRPILLVGTYRPDEVALGRVGERHPLEKVLGEVKRYFGNVWVDLDQSQDTEGRQFVDAFLDSEPNRLGGVFRQALFQHTGGHPLFTIELLRDMQERGDLVQDQWGRWVEGPVLDWNVLPARVEGVIEERIGRLEDDLRQVLTVASVEGESFTAEVVARVQGMDAGRLVHRLGAELGGRHRLVTAQGIRRLDGGRLSLYRFQHNLFQKYLYNELDEAARGYLHEDVGDALEEIYGDQANEIAVQLARHFVEAGIAGKAARYLHWAGEQAAARFANEEAVSYFTRALGLTPKDDLANRYTILLAREKHFDLQGKRESQLQDLTILEGLAEALNDDEKRAEVALRRGRYSESTGDYAAATEAAQAAIGFSRSSQTVGLEAESYRQWGTALWQQGECELARARFEHAMVLGAGLPHVRGSCLTGLGIVCWSLGDFAGARARFEQALGIWREIGDRRGESGVLNNLGVICAELGDKAGAQGYLEQALRVFRQIGDRRGQNSPLMNLGVMALDAGDYSGAAAYSQQALHSFCEIGDRRAEGLALDNLGHALTYLGDYAAAEVHLGQGLSIFREIDNPRGECHALRSLSFLHLQTGDYQAAQEFARQALVLAQNLGHRDLQGYVLTYLGHTLVSQGNLAEAADAYKEALALRREEGQMNLAMEPLAGLACVLLTQGDLPRAQECVEQILGHLQTGTLDGTEEPLRVYLACHQVLRAGDDPQAQEILRTAYSLLHERAARIADEAMRHSFLENRPIHGQVLREYAALTESAQSGE